MAVAEEVAGDLSPMQLFMRLFDRPRYYQLQSYNQRVWSPIFPAIWLPAFWNTPLFAAAERIIEIMKRNNPATNSSLLLQSVYYRVLASASGVGFLLLASSSNSEQRQSVPWWCARSHHRHRVLLNWHLIKLRTASSSSSSSVSFSCTLSIATSRLFSDWIKPQQAGVLLMLLLLNGGVFW